MLLRLDPASVDLIKRVPLSRNRATGEVLRRYHVGVQEEPMPLTEKTATALMTVAIAGVGPACVALLLFL